MHPPAYGPGNILKLLVANLHAAKEIFTIASSPIRNFICLSEITYSFMHMSSASQRGRGGAVGDPEHTWGNDGDFEIKYFPV